MKNTLIVKSACANANCICELCLCLKHLTLPNMRYVLIDFHALPDFLKNSPKTINQIKILDTYSWQSQHLNLEEGNSGA